MKVLFATAELSPLASVGGLADASAGLVRALRSAGVEVHLVVPDYFRTPLDHQDVWTLDVPQWASPAVARSGRLESVGDITLVEVPGMERPNPYNDGNGQAWPDNADRFFGFSAAVAAIAEATDPDIVHLNDWHTAGVLAFLPERFRTVFTIHTLGYQGWTSGGWLDRIPVRPDVFESYGGTNPLAGAVQLADRVIAVSPGYAGEILTPEGGFGLHEQLGSLGSRLRGIRNGIDVSLWDPAADTHIEARYSSRDLAPKDVNRSALLDEIGWDEDGGAVVAIVSRLVDQKGIDLALHAASYAEGVPFRIALLGAGERWLADWASYLATETPRTFWFHEGFDRAFAHRLFAGADLLLMPSRFEPCGLAQMQAMAYGTIPIVTPVGGLRDTVVDADADRRAGTGFVSRSVDVTGVVDGLHRGVRAWKQPRRRAAIQRRGMEQDWSWDGPAREHIGVYAELLGG